MLLRRLLDVITRIKLNVPLSLFLSLSVRVKHAICVHFNTPSTVIVGSVAFLFFYLYFIIIHYTHS